MNDLPQRYQTTILEHRQVSSSGYELTLERKEMPFTTGRLMTIHGREVIDNRSYTIASGEPDETLQVLYRLIPGGRLTPWLVNLKPGDPLEISGPYGEFVLRDPQRPIVFVATGTGIAPCRSYVRTHPNLNLTLFHGVRDEEDLFYRDEFSPYGYYPCLSGSDGSEYPKRVTEALHEMELEENNHFYLCGANEMIFNVYDLLRKKGVDDANIFSEEYYYRFESV